MSSIFLDSKCTKYLFVIIPNKTPLKMITNYWPISPIIFPIVLCLLFSMHLLLYYSWPFDSDVQKIKQTGGHEFFLENSATEEEENMDQLEEEAERRRDSHREEDFVFIGGFPRSGTTLLRAMLEAHPDVRCGEETKVIPQFLEMRDRVQANETEMRQFQQLGIDAEAVDAAFGDFIATKIIENGKQAPRLCNKDPFALKWTLFLAKIFLNAKFVLILRDGRAVVHSLLANNLTHECGSGEEQWVQDNIGKSDEDLFLRCLHKWSTETEAMLDKCKEVGENRCLPIYYEKLVLQPERQMRRLLAFLHLPWNEAVLHHELFIGSKILLSPDGLSSQQVSTGLKEDALGKWAEAGRLPATILAPELLTMLDRVAPMLSRLGYSQLAIPPDYKKLESSSSKF